jgi:hypothetical protein
MTEPVSEETVRAQLDVIEANLDAHHPGAKHSFRPIRILPNVGEDGSNWTIPIASTGPDGGAPIEVRLQLLQELKRRMPLIGPVRD